MTNSKRPTLTERRAEELRMSIALTARDLFVAEGDTSATVERICEIVGIAPRTFHRHFPVKEDVLMPLLRRSERVIVQALDEAPDDADPAEVLASALTTELARRQVPEYDHQIMTLIITTPQYRLRFVEWCESLSEPITRFLARYYELDADPFLRELPARLVIQTLRQALIHWVESGRSGDFDELATWESRGLRLALSGLTPRTASE
ncbi:TetR/AcrR family transcriptional regulator [Amycolatopsis viridis]|uniref:AcrR family transcriptional regulator n=1 Tax=Amycolatopsis viridis TaxID=185678 RepID=A0ABX0SWJ0_9PSEU|nr:TetR/AcrR family transcriptional regulator [Amycolatopsis viridis]NIH80784.1 AcrR family transcriptional regulator [Amycolatopsis viridis]